MNVFPSTPLTRDVGPEAWLDFAPRPAEWRALEGEIAHVFTHFALGAQVLVSRVGLRASAPPATRWVSCESLADAGLPTLMRKAAIHAGLLGGKGA
jgi:A/G-specific adenine glycosylase